MTKALITILTNGEPEFMTAIVTIKSDTGQHSQFSRCFKFWRLRLLRSITGGLGKRPKWIHQRLVSPCSSAQICKVLRHWNCLVFSGLWIMTMMSSEILTGKSSRYLAKHKILESIKMNQKLFFVVWIEINPSLLIMVMMISSESSWFLFNNANCEARSVAEIWTAEHRAGNVWKGFE